MDKGEGSYRRYLAGDDEGIAEIVRNYKDGLILYLNSYVMNIHTAEDLAEDVFFKLMVKRPRFSPRFSFRAWLYAIGRNLAIDFMRRQRKKSELSPEDENALAEEEDLERSYIKNEERIAVHRCLARIKEDYSEVLYLTYFEGFTNEDAARIMKKNKHQIETLIYRAKKSLRKELEREGFCYEEH
ncbi:MAG: RNA polymerase sigma factor [Clostridia bacterium]|nr:RNA polymerase sigma factor [Clostridia bacterium]